MAAQVRPAPYRRGARFAVLAVAALLLAGCQSAPVPAPDTEVPVRPAAGSAPSSVSFAPLRGTAADASELAHPSLAVKIDNHEEARPHLALNRTDLVFEELVEGGITRYVAVWHSDVPDEVGPVRSIRPMDPDIASPFGGIIAYSGGQEQFVEMMMATPLLNLVFDYDDTGLFSRADDRPGPHDVVLRAGEAVSRNAALAPPPMQFSYGTADPLVAPALAAAPTSRIDLVFSDARFPAWEWDGAASTWLRSQEGSPDLEASGERVGATNIVTLRVGIDWSYGEVPKTVMIGSGEAWVSAAGRTAHGTWAKDAAGSPITLTADDGSPLRLAPGNTWVELVPGEGSATFTP
ncbi:DUF3048 domain-containing protein [Agromyces badenianii]|uniref:DUF3048 domain-containing protein n=1 Tax=Agromyces badenianii TaxID=2080742 RepID=A0A2S0WXR6_9MICO|nr:DUF3048 domain-containing protein [Agromyces badenianii]AWB96070.1 DUF3048 domain-containing protein [Agromyces badenianii]